MSYLRSRENVGRFSLYKKAITLLAIVCLVVLRGPIASFLFPILAVVASPLWSVREILVAERGLDPSQAKIDVLLARVSKLEQDFTSDDSRAIHVLSSLSVTPYGTILLDSGKTEGVLVGDHLSSKEGVAFGEVVEVYERTAKAILYSVYGKNIEVVLEDGTRFIMTGAGNQNFEARLPTGMELAPSELLYLPGQEHYVLARIEKIEALPGSAFQRVLARSPVNIHSVSNLYVRP
jgi:cell shape-determining protein MreC